MLCLVYSCAVRWCAMVLVRLIWEGATSSTPGRSERSQCLAQPSARCCSLKAERLIQRCSLKRRQDGIGSCCDCKCGKGRQNERQVRESQSQKLVPRMPGALSWR